VSAKKSACVRHATGVDLVVRSMKSNSLSMSEKGLVTGDDAALNVISKKMLLCVVEIVLLAITRARAISGPAKGSKRNKMRLMLDAQGANRALAHVKTSLKSFLLMRVRSIGLDADRLVKNQYMNVKKLTKL
jgi:hypothetical protein